MNSSKLLFKLTFVLATLLVATPFTPTQPSTIRSISSLQVTKEEEAATITDFMAKAHEEKIRAMAQVEAKYKDRVAELEHKIAVLEGPSTANIRSDSNNSYAFPATNKALTEKVRAYQTFLSKYIVSASLEKQKAVNDAEAKTAAKYEAVLSAIDRESP